MFRFPLPKPRTDEKKSNKANAGLMSLAEFSIDVRPSKRRKSFALEISNGQVIARCPARAAQSDVKAFITSKLAWLRRNQRFVFAPPRPIRLENGLELALVDRVLSVRYAPELSGGKAFISTSANVPTLVVPLKRCENQQHSAERKVVAFLRDYFLEYAQARLNLTAQTMQLSAKSLSTRDYKRRWGSCDRAGNISLNWRLVFADPEVVDYVITHELAHLKVFNHSANFWRLVEQYCPNYQFAKKWLMEKGGSLYRYFS